jgi:hypothetical protein
MLAQATADRSMKLLFVDKVVSLCSIDLSELDAGSYEVGGATLCNSSETWLLEDKDIRRQTSPAV